MLQAVLLAAGVGSRLQEITGGGPKCLLPFAGQSLLARHLQLLAGFGVERLTIVTGCEAMQLGQQLGDIAPECAPHMRIETCHNADFRSGSAVSVQAAGTIFDSGDDVLLMDADVLYDARLLAPLLDSGNRNVVTIDRSVAADDAEAVKVAVKDGHIVDFAKTLTSGRDASIIGESAGFFRMEPEAASAFVNACRRSVEADPDSAYEPALAEVLTNPTHRFETADITGLPWIEIDYPGDVDYAAEQIQPVLQPIDSLS